MTAAPELQVLAHEGDSRGRGGSPCVLDNTLKEKTASVQWMAGRGSPNPNTEDCTIVGRTAQRRSYSAVVSTLPCARPSHTMTISPIRSPTSLAPGSTCLSSKTNVEQAEEALSSSPLERDPLHPRNEIARIISTYHLVSAILDIGPLANARRRAYGELGRVTCESLDR